VKLEKSNKKKEEVMKKVFSAILAVSFLFAVGSVAFAQSAVDAVLNGLKITGSGDVTFLGYNRLNAVDNNVGKDHVEYRIELHFDKTFSNGSSAKLRLRGGSVDDGQYALGSFRGGLNDNAFGGYAKNGDNNNDRIIVKEVYFTQPFEAPVVGKSSIVVGKIGTPTSGNAVSGSIGSFFTDDATVPAAMGTSQNPYGVKVSINPVDLVTITYAYLDQDHGVYNDVDYTTYTTPYAGSDINSNNLTQGAYNTIEANFKPIANGNYRVGYWYSARRYNKISWAYDGDTKAWTDQSKERDTDFPNGAYISVDQVVIDNISVFGRYGKRLDSTTQKSQAGAGQDFQVGAKVGGSFWGRANDYIFFGFGMAWYLDNIQGESNKVITGLDNDGYPVYDELKPEQHFELNYSIGLSEGVSIIVFGQYVNDFATTEDAINDGGTKLWKVDANGYALGLRTAIKF
jgi:hypothetical protein